MRRLLWANYTFYVSKDMLKAIMKNPSGKLNNFFHQSKDYHHMPDLVQRAIAKYKHYPSV